MTDTTGRADGDGGAGGLPRHRGPERFYVLTGGRSRPSRDVFTLVTLIVAAVEPDPGMQPEHVAVLELCRYPLSVAETAAALTLPVSITKIILADMLDQQRITVRPPVAAVPDVHLLEAVIDGLRKL